MSCGDNRCNGDKESRIWGSGSVQGRRYHIIQVKFDQKPDVKK